MFCILCVIARKINNNKPGNKSKSSSPRKFIRINKDFSHWKKKMLRYSYLNIFSKSILTSVIFQSDSTPRKYREEQHLCPGSWYTCPQERYSTLHLPYSGTASVPRLLVHLSQRKVQYLSITIQSYSISTKAPSTPVL